MNNRNFFIKVIQRVLRILVRIYADGELLIKESNCILGEGSELYSASKIHNYQNDKNSITIGVKTFVSGELLIFKHGGAISIGQNCFIGENSKIWSMSKIEIGDRVLISHGVNIHDNNSHSLSAEMRHQHFVDIFATGHPEDLHDVPTQPIVIEDDVWIGFNATILKGVKIGKGAVVGACSVVTKDVEPYTIVVGNPARVVGNSKE